VALLYFDTDTEIPDVSVTASSPVRRDLPYVSNVIIFVYLIADITRNYYSNNIRHAGRDTTAATQGSTIYRRVKPAKMLPHTAHSD